MLKTDACYSVCRFSTAQKRGQIAVGRLEERRTFHFLRDKSTKLSNFDGKHNFSFPLKTSNYQTLKIQQKVFSRFKKKRKGYYPWGFFNLLAQIFFTGFNFSTFMSDWGNQKLLKPMCVAQFVDFKGPKRGDSSRPGGSRERRGASHRLQCSSAQEG